MGFSKLNIIPYFIKSQMISLDKYTKISINLLREKPMQALLPQIFRKWFLSHRALLRPGDGEAPTRWQQHRGSFNDCQKCKGMEKLGGEVFHIEQTHEFRFLLVVGIVLFIGYQLLIRQY